MTTVAQQNWRQRGQLPWGKGKPEPINALLAAEIFIRYRLSVYGIPPSESAEIGKKAASHVLWHALLRRDGACSVYGPEEDVDKFIDNFANNDGLASKLTHLAPGLACSYLVRPDGTSSPELCHDVGEVLQGDVFMDIAILDLCRLGTLLADGSERPLIFVELMSDDIGKAKWVRRLTRG